MKLQAVYYYKNITIQYVWMVIFFFFFLVHHQYFCFLPHSEAMTAVSSTGFLTVTTATECPASHRSVWRPNFCSDSSTPATQTTTSAGSSRRCVSVLTLRRKHVRCFYILLQVAEIKFCHIFIIHLFKNNNLKSKCDNK